MRILAALDWRTTSAAGTAEDNAALRRFSSN
jgi:hypothetical protein